MKLICKECWIEFNSDKNSRKYCSRWCYNKTLIWKQHPANLAGKRWVKPRKRTISKCIICWKDFEHQTIRNAKYCSRECWSKRNPAIFNQCLYCWNDVWTYKSRNKVYCWNKCRSLHLRELKKWEKSPFWKWWVTKQNKLDRTRTIYLEWRQKVFERDNYTCQDCWIRSWNWKKIYLQAHHKKWFADYPENRYDVDNGITLCKDCHLLRHHHKF